ncbi:helix-turn-helix domain-containing protein [Pseudothermotoga sp.]|nr:hypothetical protein [Pseudothermotoga sp.]MCX7813306.1 hypothetical protein [Pseudothermotoga sp.]MDW8140619.1 helix-turn-helix domain-containing protein [Pseudothermotoga sp.]
MIKVLLPSHVLSNIELSSSREKLLIDVYDEKSYEKKLLEEFWDVVMGPKKFDSPMTIFVNSVDGLLMAIKYLETKDELEELKKKHEVLYSFAELQGVVAHEVLRRLQKLRDNDFQAIALVAERGVQLLAYLEYFSAGKYVQLEEGMYEVNLNGRRKTVVLSECPVEGFHNVHIPPLRERKNDIPYMVDWILSSIHQKHRYIPIKFPNEEIMNLFLKYDWPGNTEELVKVVHMYAADLDVISYFANYVSTRVSEETKLPEYVKRIVESIEKRTIKNALEKCNWNRKKTAFILGLNYKTLCYKIKKYGITK